MHPHHVYYPNQALHECCRAKKRLEILHKIALLLGNLPAPSPSQWLFSFVSSMHEALLIDEIFGSILDHHLESETSAVASKLARTCTAWRDPVLDRVWRTLTDIQPLLATLEKAESQGCTVLRVTPAFQSYAGRIKDIRFHSPPPALDTEHSILLPNLTSVTLRGHGCEIPYQWISSRHLNELSVSIGSHVATPLSVMLSQHTARNLALLVNSAAKESLRSIRLRGWMCPELNGVIGAFTGLRSLTLLGGRSLTSEILASITIFPSLRDLRLQADHIDPMTLLTKIPAAGSATTFPSLQSLRVEAQLPLLRALISFLQPETIEEVHLETRQYISHSSEWIPIFSSNTVANLRKLTIEHIIDIEDIDQQLSNGMYNSNIRLTLDTLKPLRNTSGLEELTITTTLPVNLADEDIKELSSWWPSLKLLDISSFESLDQDLGVSLWKPRLTTDALVELATNCPFLRRLSLPLDLTTFLPTDDAKNTKLIKRHALESISIAHSQPPTSHGFGETLLKIFPSVKTVEYLTQNGPVPVDMEDIRKHNRLGEDRDRVGTADGYANGQ